MSGEVKILQQDASGEYSLPSVARTDIDRIDISDVDLLITTKNGQHYLVPNGGIAAMDAHPPSVHFADGSVSASSLLGEVSTALNMATSVPMPSSFKISGAKDETNGKEQELSKTVHKLQEQSQQQQEVIKQLQHQIEHQKNATACDADGTSLNAATPSAMAHNSHSADGKDPCAPKHDDHQATVAPLNLNTEMSIEQMVANLEKMEANLHNSDYAYVPPQIYTPPPAPPMPPPGVPPPISLEPLINLFMGNVVGTTVDTTVNPGYTTYYGGGGAVSSDATAGIGPRDALQWSAATITGDNGNDIIYAEGPLVGNTNPAVSNTAMYAKEFLLNVAGYFTTLNAITISGVPTGVTLTGATNMGGGVWSLPASYVLGQQVFTMYYSTANYVPGGNNTFTLTFDVTGTVTHGVEFKSVQSVEFEYMNITDVSQITNPTLVYDQGGLSQEIYVLPTLDQPNIITAGDGNDIIHGSPSNDTITLGNGNNTIIEGGGNDAITTGNGNSTITAANGNDVVTVGTGVNSITLGNGNNTIFSAGGGGTFSVGGGANVFTVKSITGSTNNYTITATGAGATTVTGGDDNYGITTGTGKVTIVLGAGNNTITTSGGGGTISTGSGNQTIQLNSTSGSKDTYGITTTGTGNTNIAAGDDNYTIAAGASGTNTISVGNGNSTITATNGTGVDTVTTGNGAVSVTLGNGAGDTVTIGSGTAVADIVTVAVGNGVGDSVTTHGSTLSVGTVAIGSGNNDTLNIGSGNYTVTVGGANGVTNTLSLTSGSGDSVTVGGGNNTVYIGSHASGTDTLTLGNGNNTVYVGTGTDVLNAGTGVNTLNFSQLASALTIDFGTTGTSNAVGTGVNDSFTGFTTIYGTNHGDTITLNTGNLNVYDGSGNDTITLGGGTDVIYAGNGNNTIIGTDLTSLTNDALYGGTGNNTYTHPDAQTTYNPTNGAALTAVANNLAYSFTNTSATNPFANAAYIPSSLNYTYAGGVATVDAYLQQQINTVSYAASAAGNLTIDLALGAGSGSGGAAQGSTYAFTPVTGYSTINEVIGNGWGDSLTPSYDNTILISASPTSVGGGDASFYDGATLASQTVIDVAAATAYSNGGLLDTFYLGLANEIIVANPNNSDRVAIGWNEPNINTSNSAGAVVNLDSVTHTFYNSALGGTTLTLDAYTGYNFGADQVTAGNPYGFNTGLNSLSFTAGDFFVPVSGTSTDINSWIGSPWFTNIVYGGSNFLSYYAGTNGGFFYAGSGGSLYFMEGDWAVAVAQSGGTNIFTTHNDAYDNTAYSISVILNKHLDTGAQATQDAGVNLTFGGTTYAGFAYGFWGLTNPSTAPLTYITGYENILGYTGNDYFVGDNNNDQFNAEGGSNTIILGDATNIVTAIQGTNVISSSSASGQTIGINTLNFETVNDANSGVLATYSSGSNAMVDVFLNYSGTSTQSTFFSASGDETAFFGGAALAAAYQARTGTTNYSYDNVQAAIISTVNGSDYASGVTNSNAASTASASFTYDNVYSGATTIIGHAGNDVFIDNVGTAAQTFNGSADASNIYYMTAAQVPDVTVVASAADINILRVEAWGATVTSGNAFGTSDPFTTTRITGITDLDVRSGTDNVSGPGSSLVTIGANSTNNTHAPTFNLSAADIQNLTGVASTPTLVLKLDSGDLFVPTGTVSTVTSGNTISYYNSATHNGTTLIATDTHNAASYYTDTLVFNNANNAHLNIHYGTG